MPVEVPEAFPTAIKLDSQPENVYDFTTFKLMTMMDEYAKSNQMLMADQIYQMLSSYEGREACIIWARGLPIAYKLEAPEGFKRELLEKVSELLNDKEQ